MGILSDIRVRQPAKSDLVGKEFTVSGIGTGFEGTIGMRVLNRAGKVIATGFAQSSGGMAADRGVQYDAEGQEPTASGYAGHAAGLRGQPGAGTGTRERPARGGADHVPRPVRLPALPGREGRHADRHRRKARDFGKTTVPQIVAANSQIKDPDLIQTGWKLRIPLSN